MNVKPEDIEKELDKLSEQYKQKNRTRACLFNLIVYTRHFDRFEYFKSLSTQVMLQFPCRLLFIEETEEDLVDVITSVSAKMVGNADNKVHCDEIHLKVPSSSLHKVPFIILPHILPDLPVYLLWAHDPTTPNLLFDQIKNLASRLIFDSECIDDLSIFAKNILDNQRAVHLELADLNWVRLEGWREILKNVFNSPEKIDDLMSCSHIRLTYNDKKTKAFSHNAIQAHYLHAWLATQLQWCFHKRKKEGHIEKVTYLVAGKPICISIEPNLSDAITPGSILSLHLVTKNGSDIHLEHVSEGVASLRICSRDKCDLPYNAYLPHARWEYSFAREICYKETSHHYSNMLETLSHMKGRP